jgi:CRISPR/Cas system Type II protein with McrA/HNH and RuvC-like nuclease domain
VLAGVSDLFLARASGFWHGLFLELKVKGGKLSPAQSKFLESMARENYFTAVRYSADEAISTIKEYLQMT